MTYKKILATDLDGTLLKNDKSVSLDTINSIQEMISKGHYFVITTGRPFHRIVQVVDQLGIKSSNNYCICFNGGLITTTDNSKVLYECKLKEAEIIELINLSASLEISIMLYLKDIILVDKIPETVAYLKNLDCLKIVSDGKKALIKEKEVYKIIYIGSREEVELAKSKIPLEILSKYNFVRSSANYLEITSKNVNKGEGLIKLAEILDVDLKDTIAVGDEENDLSMIAKAALGCCVSNANPRLLEIAKYITSSNEEDGVRKIIDKFILEK